jgi:hypothetical protein
MYARWLVCLETVALAVLIYCAYVAGKLRFEGIHMGLDEAFDPESRAHYILWRSYSRETLLLLAALWLIAVGLAVYAQIRGGNSEFGIARFGSRAAIGTTVILPIAGVLAGFTFGLELGLGL